MTDQAAITAEHVVWTLLVVGTLVLPWFVFTVLRRAIARRAVPKRAALTTLSAVAATLLSVYGLLFSFCYYPGPPGVGAVPEAGKRRADLVASALEDFRVSHGRFPPTLQALPPSALPDTALARFQAVVGSALRYEPDSLGRSFRLEFSYFGPGSNRCSRTDSTTAWRCNGVF